MPALWPPAELPGLHIDMGHWDRRAARWLRFPTADYRCGQCGEVESASGDAVRAFVATIHRVHQAECTAHTQGT
ncbi:hypothetical protein ACFYO0_14440 [Streptomyces sp. NPDC006365]|uniref:hypothetical protein n=1 Tax=Streptomyces sp. NPDC006365 TaxID=3364744 RepID=UPI0036C5801B